MSAILLTNRLKNLKLFFSFIGAIILATILSVVFAKGCSTNVPDEQPRYTKLGRAGSAVIISDTTKPKVDSLQLQTKFYDSVSTHTTIKDFQVWLYKNVTAEDFQEAKFLQLYTYFLQVKYKIWLQHGK